VEAIQNFIDFVKTVFGWIFLIGIIVFAGAAGYSVGGVMGALLIGGGVAIWAFAQGGEITYRVLRGNKLSSYEQARRVAERHLRNGDTGILFGRLCLPSKVATQHLLISGTTGSGKTLLIRLLMQKAFADIGLAKPGGNRALIYDGKKDLLGLLYGMLQPHTLHVNFDPFDSRSVRWDIASDVSDPASAREMAAILFPKEDAEHQPFFPLALQLLAGGIMTVFMEKASGQWTFADLIYALKSPDRIRKILQSTERGQETLSQIFSEGDTLNNIMATLATRLQDYEIVASLWNHAETAYSLTEWSDGEAVILLRKHHIGSKAVDAINRALFHRASQLLLSKPNSESGRSWIILDELATAGKLEGLSDLMDKGRSKGVCTVLGFQNISGLKEAYGEYGAEKLTALCTTKALLRFEDETNATWASGYFGRQEVRVTTKNKTQNSDGNSSTSTSYEDRDREVVMYSEFQNILPVSNRNGLTGFFTTALTGPYKDTIPGSWLFREGTLAPDLTEHNFVPRPPDQQWLRSWTEADMQRLTGKSVVSSKQLPSSCEDKNGHVSESDTAKSVGASRRRALLAAVNSTPSNDAEDAASAAPASSAVPASTQTKIGLPKRAEVETWDFSKSTREVWDFSQKP